MKKHQILQSKITEVYKEVQKLHDQYNYFHEDKRVMDFTDSDIMNSYNPDASPEAVEELKKVLEMIHQKLISIGIE